MYKLTHSLVGLLLVIITNSAYAGTQHTLINPTPSDQLRPMTTERSSKTDSPYSVDAGHFQVESNLYSYVNNDDCIDGTCVQIQQHFFGGSTNIRLGLTDNIDLQIIGDLYRYLTLEGSSIEQHKSGYGDTIVRIKINSGGNNSSDQFSLGILPYIKFPTNQDNLGNDELEGGIGLPFNVNFDDGWSLGGMTQFNLIAESDSSGYDPSYANSIIVGKAITDKLSTYAEFYTYRANQLGAKWQNTADFGTAYMLRDNFRIDANIQFGVTDSADDVNFFFGTAYRF